MAKLYLCHECQVRDIDTNILKENEDYIKRGNFYYHKSCYDLREYRKKHPSVKIEANDDFWKDAAYDYLRFVVKVEVSTLFFKQWHDYLNKNKDYSAKGLYFALLYFYDIKKGDKDKSNGGIGIIPYVYDESKRYWYERESRQSDIVAQIEQQVREAAERKTIVLTKKEVKPRKFEVDFSVLDDLEDDE